MFDANTSKAVRQSVFVGSIQGLANTLAFAAAFFGTPLLYDASAGWVNAFVLRHYGTGLAEYVQYGWFAILACVVFFIARASLATALVMGGLAVAMRFL